METDIDQPQKSWKTWCKIPWFGSTLGSIEKRARFCEWGLHNVVFGFAGIWVPFLALAFFGYFRWREALLDGDLVMFAVTASAVSLGFFVKETQVDLRKTEMFTYAGLMITMIAGVITRVVLAFAAQFSSAASLQVCFLAVVTCVLVICAIGLNFRLFTLELKSIERKDVERKLYAPAAELSEKAASLNRIDGINL